MSVVARAAAGSVAGVALTAGWLTFGPRLASSWTQGGSAVVAEALFTVLVFVPLLALAVLGGWATGIRALRWGGRPVSAMALGAALGLGGLLLASGYAALAGTVGTGDVPAGGVALLLGIGVVALQVLAEEALFRGWLQPLLAPAIGRWPALAAVAVAFAALHMIGGWAGPIAAFNMLGGGVLFGLLAMRGGGIGGAWAAHLAWNGSEQLLLGLDPNPGVGGFGSWWNLDLSGPATWGGSADGLNASWAMALALVAVTVPLLLLRSEPAS